MGKKGKMIEQGKIFLASRGITHNTYTVSLQGPTFIFHAGTVLTDEIKKKFSTLGLGHIGG